MPRINLMELAEQSFGTSLEQLDDRRIYKLLVKLVQERSAARPLNNGKKKLYYISAEFLIGKLLINNMIDLGIYDEVKDQLTAAGHDLNKIEESRKHAARRPRPPLPSDGSTSNSSILLRSWPAAVSWSLTSS